MQQHKHALVTYNTDILWPNLLTIKVTPASAVLLGFHCSNHIYCEVISTLPDCVRVRVGDSRGMQTSSCSYFLLYSHPLQLSGIGCMPPPTPIALPSITPRCQRTDTSSHSHSASNITLLHQLAHTFLLCSFVRVRVTNRCC